jgi:uncharacterized protein
MVSQSDATLNLARLLRHSPDSPDEVTGYGQLAAEAGQLEKLGLQLDGPLIWRLVVRNTGGGEDNFLVDGDVEGTALLDCGRCLQSVPAKIASDFLYPMSFLPGTEQLTLAEIGDGKEDEELLFFGQPEVDFGPMLVQLFAIDLPLTALCKESCKGLSLDGVNLNDHPEIVEELRPSGSSAFAVLKDLDLQ